VPNLPWPCWVMELLQDQKSISVDRGDGGRTLQQTCIEMHLTAPNCLYISGFWGFCHQTPTGALPLVPAGGLPSSRSLVTSELAYATVVKYCINTSNKMPKHIKEANKHTALNSHFPARPGLASCPLNSHSGS